MAKESAIISIVVPTDMIRKIEAIATRRGMKRAAVIRELLEAGLDRTSASVDDLQAEVERIAAALKKIKG